MKVIRPRCFLLVSLFMALLALQEIALAQGFPSRPIKLIVPFAPGGTDVSFRILAGKLGEIWKQPVVVENRTGGSSIIATDLVAKAPPDGYTLLGNVTLIVQNPSLYEKLPYDPYKDIVPVTQVFTEQLLLVISASSSAKSLSEFIDLAKRNHGTYNFASYGSGSTAHILLGELNKGAGIDLLHVPYKGTVPAMQALLSGEAQVALLNFGTAKPQINAGKLRVIAAMGSKRSNFVPGVPTFEEQGVKGFAFSNWGGLFVPGGTPKGIVSAVASAVTAAVRSAEVAAKLQEFGQDPAGGMPEEFAEIFDRDLKFYARAIKSAGIRAE